MAIGRRSRVLLGSHTRRWDHPVRARRVGCSHRLRARERPIGDIARCAESMALQAAARHRHPRVRGLRLDRPGNDHARLVRFAREGVRPPRSLLGRSLSGPLRRSWIERGIFHGGSHASPEPRDPSARRLAVAGSTATGCARRDGARARRGSFPRGRCRDRAVLTVTGFRSMGSMRGVIPSTAARMSWDPSCICSR